MHSVPFSQDNDRLTDDLVWIRDMAGDASDWLLDQDNIAFVCSRIERGLDSKSHYLPTVNTVLDLLALAIRARQFQAGFAEVAEIIRQHPPQLTTPFQVDFRSVIADFQQHLDVYTQLHSAPILAVDDLLQAYIRLLKVLSFNHGMSVQQDLIDQALMVSRRLNDHMENARLHQTLALYYTLYGDLTLAEIHGKHAFRDYEYVEDAGGVADAACTLAIIYRVDLRLPKVAYYIDRALSRIREKTPDKRYATLYYEKGALSYSLENYGEALQFYQQALTIFEEHGAVHQTAMAYQSMAQAYIHLKDFAKAESLLFAARRGWEKLDNRYDLTNNYFIEGDLEIHRGNLKEGLAMLKQTVEMAYQSLEDTPGRETLIHCIQECLAFHSSGRTL
ncbi:MAG: tetratricopeptide repeat protein [Chloroflexota bacterium]